MSLSPPKSQPWATCPRPLKTCALCGAKRVRRRRVSVRLRTGGTVTGVEADVCEACGERYYDLAAMHKLQAAAKAQ